MKKTLNLLSVGIAIFGICVLTPVLLVGYFLKSFSKSTLGLISLQFNVVRITIIPSLIITIISLFLMRGIFFKRTDSWSIENEINFCSIENEIRGVFLILLILTSIQFIPNKKMADLELQEQKKPKLQREKEYEAYSKSVSLLSRDLKSPQEEIRNSAISNLVLQQMKHLTGYHPDKTNKIVELLIPMLEDPSKKVRYTATEKLCDFKVYHQSAKIPTQKIIPFCLEMFQESDETYREIAIRSLKNLGNGLNKEVTSILIPALNQEKSPRLKALIIDAIENTNGAKAFNSPEKYLELIKALQIAEISIRYDRKTHNAIQRLKNDALRTLNPMLKQDPLIQKLFSANEEIFNEGIKELEQVSPERLEEVFSFLISVAFCSKENSLYAQKMWNKIGIRSLKNTIKLGMPYLIQALKEGHMTNQILQVFSDLGPNAIEAVPVLLEIFPKSDSYLQKKIKETLKKVDPVEAAKLR